MSAGGRIKMKLPNNEFKCGWCGKIKRKTPLKNMETRNTTPYSQVICDNCGRHISQKTKLEMTR